MKQLTLALLLVLGMTTLSACTKDDGNGEPDLPATVVDIATDDDTFSTLVSALEAADLVGTLQGDGPFTVFAPTNAAFEALLTELGITAEELLAREDLADILTYHVVSGKLLAADVVKAVGDGGGTAEVVTLNGAPITVTLDGETVKLNGDVTVTSTNLEADNGVVHVIDTVLVPPTPEVPATVVDYLADNDEYSTLVAAVTAAGLVETLQGEGPFTVFAPSNAAFEALLTELGVSAEELLAREDLSSILTYHVVPGRLGAEDILAALAAEDDGVLSVETVNGATFDVTTDGDAVKINGDTTVVATDLEAGNGVVHGLDGVLLPPSD